MSKHRKKKPNQRNLDKINRAQQKNEYIRKIRKVLDAIGCLHVLALMPDDELDYLYDIRCRAINVSIDKGDVMTPAKLKWIRRLISAMLKRYEVQLIKDGKSVDLDTFFSAGITLIWYGNSLEYEAYPKAKEVKDALIPYALDKHYKNTAFIHLRHIASTTGLMMSDITKRIYWATVNLNIDDDTTNVGFQMKWHSAPAEKFYARIKGESHLTYRLGMPEYQKGPKWSSIADMHLKLPDCKLQKPVDVYIQAHALQRLCERNDCITREIVTSELIRSVDNAKMQYYPDPTRILIDFCLYGIKTGYLLASMAGNKLVIRTFLFITHNGSPEGEKLRRNARLKKDDIPFLELDRLSTFMTTELQENKHIKQYFAEAGMKSIFDLHKILTDKNISITKHANTTLIEDYLGIDLTREFIEEETDEEEQSESESESENEDDDEREGEMLAEAQPINDAKAKESVQTKPKISIVKRIFVGLLAYLLRTIAIVLPFSDRTDENFKTEAEKAEAEKSDKFSSSRLSLGGKILGWILIIIFMVPSFIIYVLWSLIRGIFIKNKKKDSGKIDYRQFVGGRKKKKGRK
jgi:hypothetical protein